jgi:hypothetical protein
LAAQRMRDAPGMVAVSRPSPPGSRLSVPWVRSLSADDTGQSKQAEIRRVPFVRRKGANLGGPLCMGRSTYSSNPHTKSSPPRQKVGRVAFARRISAQWRPEGL